MDAVFGLAAASFRNSFTAGCTATRTGDSACRSAACCCAAFQPVYNLAHGPRCRP